MDDVERIDIAASGDTDMVVINSLAGTDVVDVRVNLAPSAGTGGDGTVDTVRVNATAGNDTINVSGSASNYGVGGLASAITVSNAEAQDALVVMARDGNDLINALGLVPVHRR